MNFRIKHEIKGRLRIHLEQKRMTDQQADLLLYYIQNLEQVTDAKVYGNTADAVIVYQGERAKVLEAMRQFRYEKVDVPEGALDHTGRELNTLYREKLVNKVLFRVCGKMFVPMPIRSAYTTIKSVKYIWKGVRSLAKRRLEVDVLDAAAIGVSILRRDFQTAGSVMFLLGIGEILEEWTHKKSVGDLARSMSLNVSRVWLKCGEQEVLVPAKNVQPGDEVVIHMGNVIPFDGVVSNGEAMVNQASMTGEPVAVRKTEGSYVYAGTVIEEGGITIQVKAVSGATRYEKIVHMIEDSEKLKSAMESKAERLADKLVPYTLAGTGAVWLFTRNVTKALAVLMVDFSCALKLSMPIAVLSAIREANSHRITVKGGKFMEAIAEADTIVFDKTGTLTEAQPTFKDILVFNGKAKDEMIRIAACLEEHFPHSVAKAVVNEAKLRGLDHDEMHSKVNYIVAHGIASSIENKKVIIGSYHFIFEDEQCTMTKEQEKVLGEILEEYTRLYMAAEQRLVAVILIEDPIRKEAPEVIEELRKLGIKKIVMMTGDGEKSAAAIAKKAGLDEYYAEVLPEDKAGFVEKEKAKGRKVIMIGDGINDSPALSAADVGIAVSDGAELAREIADITIAGNDLYTIVNLKKLSNGLMKRIRGNYRKIVGINTALIGLGVSGVIMPTTSALFHNTSTLAISLKSMENILEKD